MPNLIQVLNACEVRRLTQIKFDNATSVASSTEPVESIFDRSQPLSFVPNRIFTLCLIHYNPQFSIFSQLYKKIAHDSTSKKADLLFK